MFTTVMHSAKKCEVHVEKLKSCIAKQVEFWYFLKFYFQNTQCTENYVTFRWYKNLNTVFFFLRIMRFASQLFNCTVTKTSLHDQCHTHAVCAVCTLEIRTQTYMHQTSLILLLSHLAPLPAFWCPDPVVIKRQSKIHNTGEDTLKIKKESKHRHCATFLILHAVLVSPQGTKQYSPPIADWKHYHWKVSRQEGQALGQLEPPRSMPLEKEVASSENKNSTGLPCLTLRVESK